MTKIFPGAPDAAVDSLTIDVPKGTVISLIGPSGCGKTTTLRMINRLIEPTSGRIEFNDIDVEQRPVAELRRDMGYVIQQVGLFPHRTIAQNIATVPKTLGWERDRIDDRIRELSTLVGLDDHMLDRYPDELSGGQQQRVGVARALAADPPVLLMDEPFGAVDPIVRSRLQDELLSLQAKVQKTIVLVTHDLDEALKLSDRIALLNVGGVLEQYAEPDELLRAPANEFVESFVGEDRGVKRLQLSTVGDLTFNQGPVIDIDSSVEQALTLLDEHRSGWLGVLDGERFLGWVRRSEIEPGVPLADVARSAPAGRINADSTLRNALELIMSSNTSMAVIEKGGRFAGIVTLEQLRTALAGSPEADR